MEQEREPKAICGARILTRSIAWFQVIGNFLMLILVPMFFDHITAMSAVDAEHLPLLYLTMKQFEAAQPYFPLIFGVYLVLAVLKLVMGVVLLKGTYKKKPKLLESWTHYSYLIFVFELFSASVQGIVTDGAGIGARLFILFSEVIAYDVFTIIVDRHRRELLAEIRRKLQAANALH